MANVKDKVIQIRQAIFGKDVRESIASGIEEINKEVENNSSRQTTVENRQTTLETQFDEQIKNMTLQDPSSAELVAARTKENNTSFSTIGNRLNNIDTQIEESKLKSITENANIISMSDAVDGLANITIDGNTLYKRADGTYTDIFEEGCTLESVGELEGNKIEGLSRGKNTIKNGNGENGIDFWNADTNIVFTNWGSLISEKEWTGIKQTVKLKKNTNYTFSIKECSKNCSLFVLTKESLNSTKKSVTFNTGNDELLTIAIQNNTPGTQTITFSNIQLEEGITATAYEPYKEDKLNILLPKPLREWDKVTENKATYATEKIVLNGNENITLGASHSTEDKIGFYIKNTGVTPNVRNINDKFDVAVSANTEYLYIASDGDIVISILKTRLATLDVDGFKAWLQSNPITIYYELSDPIIEKLPQQLTLQSFVNGTLQVNTAIPPQITVEYPTTLGGRITSITENIKSLKLDMEKYPNIFVGNSEPTEEQISQMKNGDMFMVLESLIPPKTMYYTGGNEYTGVTGGWKLGNHGTSYTSIFRKESNYLYLESSDTGEGSSSNCACNTTSKIDFSNINYLCIEWENVGESSTDNVSRFGLSDINNGLPNIKLLLKENTFSRRIDRIDVSDVKASYYIEIAARMLNSKDSKIKIYNVWGE